MIDHLPVSSRFQEALADDEELAERVAKNMQDETETEPVEVRRLSEWTPLLAELTVISDRLGELIRVTAQAERGIPPRPRPRTALERVRERQQIERHLKLVARLLPDRPPT